MNAPNDLGAELQELPPCVGQDGHEGHAFELRGRTYVCTRCDLHVVEPEPECPRCDVCDWPLAASADKGCAPGERIRARRAWLAMSPEEREAYKLGELIGTQQALVDVHGPALPLWALGQVIADDAEARGDDGLVALAEDVKRAGRRIAVAAVVVGWELRTVDRRGMAWLVADVIAGIGGTEFRPLSPESAANVLRTVDIEPLPERVDALVAAWR